MESFYEELKLLKKKVGIDFEGKEFKFRIGINKEYLEINIYKFKYKGDIHLIQIRKEIPFGNCNMNDIFDKIKLLDKDSFSLIKENDKYNFIIKFVKDNKEQNLKINLDKKKI